MTDLIVWLLLLAAGPASLVVGLWYALKVLKKLARRSMNKFLDWLDSLDDYKPDDEDIVDEDPNDTH